MDGYEGIRGKEVYKQPPVGWIGKGLNVSTKFDKGNDEWLGTEKNSWPVAYHACKHIAITLPQVLKGNFRDGGLRPQYNNDFVKD